MGRGRGVSGERGARQAGGGAGRGGDAPLCSATPLTSEAAMGAMRRAAASFILFAYRVYGTCASGGEGGTAAPQSVG